MNYVVSVAGVPVFSHGCDANLGVDAMNGTATVYVKPGVGNYGDTLLCEVDGSALFNGRVYGVGYTEQGRGVLMGKDVMAQMSHPYQGDERVYFSNIPASVDDDWDQEIVQNLLEAMGVPASLTSIEGASTPIGILRELRIKSGEDLMQYIRLLDKSVVPPFTTFSRGNGAVYRRQRTIGTPLITLAASDILSVTIEPGDVDTIRNGCVVNGYPTNNLPVTAEYMVANSLVETATGAQTETIDSMFIETETAALELAESTVGQLNGVLRRATVVTPINGAECLGGTMRATWPLVGWSNHDAYVSAVSHHVASEGSTSSFQVEWRD